MDLSIDLIMGAVVRIRFVFIQFRCISDLCYIHVVLIWFRFIRFESNLDLWYFILFQLCVYVLVDLFLFGWVLFGFISYLNHFVSCLNFGYKSCYLIGVNLLRIVLK